MEDFLKERRDREKLKEKYLELQWRLRKAHDELHIFKTQVLEFGAFCPMTSRGHERRTYGRESTERRIF